MSAIGHVDDEERKSMHPKPIELTLYEYGLLFHLLTDHINEAAQEMTPEEDPSYLFRIGFQSKLMPLLHKERVVIIDAAQWEQLIEKIAGLSLDADALYEQVR